MKVCHKYHYETKVRYRGWSSDSIQRISVTSTMHPQHCDIAWLGRPVQNKVETNSEEHKVETNSEEQINKYLSTNFSKFYTLLLVLTTNRPYKIYLYRTFCMNNHIKLFLHSRTEAHVLSETWLS
jgi:hypothetical protein